MTAKLFIVAFGVLCAAGLQSQPAAAAFVKKGNSKVKALPPPRPELDDLLMEEQFMAANPVTMDQEGSRKPAGHGSKIVGSQDTMTPEMIKFRDELLSLRHGEELDALLNKYDSSYDKYPNDLKYVIARLTPLIPMRGFIWRMATLAHQSVISQEILLGMVRSFTEQVMLFEPNAHWQAYMTYLSIPTPALLKAQASKGDGVQRPDQRFYVENDLSDFLVSDVYRAMVKAINRLAKLETTVTIGGRKIDHLTFDNKIRFGTSSFSNDQEYAAVDRFSSIGPAERFAAMSRFHRRLTTICQLAAYNLNGNIAMRREIGKVYGIDASISNGNGEPFSVEGVTRRERVMTFKKFAKSESLFATRDKEMMKLAYWHLYKWSFYLGKAWDVIKSEPEENDSLLDPEVFNGRREQNSKAIANLKALLPEPKISKASARDALSAKDVALSIANPDGPTVADRTGSVSGDKLQIDVMGFFFNPPDNLRDLMPSQFNEHHDDIVGLAKVYGKDKITFDEGKSTVHQKITVDGKVRDVEWRDYAFGRATGWEVDKYRHLFPGARKPGDIGEQQRVLAEIRGGRALLNTLAVFVK